MAFTPADLTLAIAKAEQDFAATTKKPTDEYIVNIRKVLTPVLMKEKPYDQLNNQHSLDGVILTEDRYKQIYKKGPHVVPPEVSVYNFTINTKARKQSPRERNWRMNPNAPTERYTMHSTLVVSTSSCLSLTRHGKRNWKIRERSTQT